MRVHPAEPLRDPFRIVPWLATGRRLTLAALDTLERAVLNLRAVLETTRDNGPEPSRTAALRDRRWLH